MRKKIIIIIIVIILIITAVVFFAIYKSQKSATAGKTKRIMPVVNKEVSDANPVLAAETAALKELEFKGEIASIGEIQIIMKNASGSQGFYISASTPVFAADGQTKSGLWNIKPGLQANVFYNETTKSANKIILLGK